MQKVSPGKGIVLLAAVIIGIGVVLHFTGKPTKTPGPIAPGADAAAPADSASAPRSRAAPPRPALPESSAPEETMGPDGLPLLSREKIEAYLARHNRNAASLLAALHATGDTNYLREAATNFPNDPRLQYTLLSRDVFPEERRKWLDAFKASAPSNSVANYLSAADYFKNGQREAALAELQEATYKRQFDNYGTDSLLDTETLCREAGLSPLMSATVAMSGMAADALPELASYKQVANGAADAQKDALAAGDTQLSLALAGMGLTLADQLRSGDSGKYVIRDLVGNATEAVLLKQLDPNTPYDFLGGKTPAQRTEEMNQSKAEIKKLTGSFSETFYRMSELEQVNFLQRVKIYGELEAWRWLEQQKKAGTAGGGN